MKFTICHRTYRTKWNVEILLNDFFYLEFSIRHTKSFSGWLLWLLSYTFSIFMEICIWYAKDRSIVLNPWKQKFRNVFSFRTYFKHWASNSKCWQQRCKPGSPTRYCNKGQIRTMISSFGATGSVWNLTHFVSHSGTIQDVENVAK